MEKMKRLDPIFRWEYIPVLSLGLFIGLGIATNWELKVAWEPSITFDWKLNRDIWDALSTIISFLILILAFCTRASWIKQNKHNQALQLVIAELQRFRQIQVGLSDFYRFNCSLPIIKKSESDNGTEPKINHLNSIIETSNIVKDMESEIYKLQTSLQTVIFSGIFDPNITEQQDNLLENLNNLNELINGIQKEDALMMSTNEKITQKISDIDKISNENYPEWIREVLK
ncbi:hypothetical protein A8139_06160 [Marinomonas primoryensis]|uniref:Uncharacterized protein n=1 Tax=Marinomonas primoryensis TaxID=178399 RepID=A0A2Z4PQ70_9GAMM|nr:hypothetical protein [Marinomonas primoryensis]AWX99622.1 hypothetical protein A8139_06160 [Marinomonas primoryensis]